MPRHARLLSAVRVAGGAAVAVLALVAAVQLLAMVGGLLGDVAGPRGIASVAAVAGMVLAMAVATVVMDRLAVSRTPTSDLLLAGLAILVLARFAAALAFDAPLIGDTLAHHDLAVGVLDGRCCFAHRPMGYPILLGAAYGTFGITPAAVELVNMALAVISGVLLFDAARRTWGRRGAALSLTLFAVLPSQILAVVPPLSEGLYATLLLAICWLLARNPRISTAVAIVTGATLAVSQYVRPTSPALLASLALAAMVQGTGRRLAGSLAAIGIAFVVVLLPVVAFNARAHGDLSISTSAYAGWSVYVGANQASDGRWNQADADRLAAFPGDSNWDRSEAAGRAAIDRIAADPVGYLGLMVRKVGVVWAEESYATHYAMPASVDDHLRGAVLLAAQVPYVALLGLVAWAARIRKRPRPAIVFVIAVTLTIVAAHLVLEADGRYHAYLEPLLALVAGGALLRSGRGGQPRS